MADRIREEHPDADIELIEGGRGDFIVTVDGDRIWDKRGSGHGHADPEYILAKLDDGR